MGTFYIKIITLNYFFPNFIIVYFCLTILH